MKKSITVKIEYDTYSKLTADDIHTFLLEGRDECSFKVTDADDELEDVFASDWYKGIKSEEIIAEIKKDLASVWSDKFTKLRLVKSNLEKLEAVLQYKDDTKTENHSCEGGDFQTVQGYWDCECESNYIHHRSVEICPNCGALSEEQPDSKTNEVFNLFNKRKGE
tara:strand:+ start:98 stop:592 length:495 start_codon:yes stop_codon:yes gene_type:complete